MKQEVCKLPPQSLEVTPKFAICSTTSRCCCGWDGDVFLGWRHLCLFDSSSSSNPNPNVPGTPQAQLQPLKNIQGFYHSQKSCYQRAEVLTWPSLVKQIFFIFPQVWGCSTEMSPHPFAVLRRQILEVSSPLMEYVMCHRKYLGANCKPADKLFP